MRKTSSIDDGETLCDKAACPDQSRCDCQGLAAKRCNTTMLTANVRFVQAACNRHCAMKMAFGFGMVCNCPVKDK